MSEAARGELFAAAVYRLVHTLTPDDFTVDDREQIASHMIDAAVEMVRSIRKNRTIDAALNREPGHGG